MIKSKVKLLDCTLRDGGYYTNWDFSKELVNEYLRTLDLIGVDFIEIGFRTLKNDSYKGPYAFCNEAHLSSLHQCTNTQLGVMINAAEVVDKNQLNIERLNHLVPLSAKESLIKLVRIACHKDELIPALDAYSPLKEKGYLVGFNLMQITNITHNDLITLIDKVQSTSPDVFYIADSIGSMTPKETENIINEIKNSIKSEIGIHAHNNIGMALANSNTAIENGASWVDATITGMGRGPGNTKTEDLVFELKGGYQDLTKVYAMANLINTFFSPLKKKYKYGKNFYYYLSGKYKIHPTYIQHLLSNNQNDTDDVIGTILNLSKVENKKLSFNKRFASMNFFTKPKPASPKACSLYSEKKIRNILLLGTGNTVATHKNELIRYIEDTQPYVLAINDQNNIPSTYIDARIACHPIKLLTYERSLNTSFIPLIAPISCISEEVTQFYNEENTYDYGLQLDNNNFYYSKYSCTIPKALVSYYSLSFCASTTPEEVLIAGFDGFENDSERTIEGQKAIDCFQYGPLQEKIYSVTPTQYDIKIKSIYGL